MCYAVRLRGIIARQRIKNELKARARNLPRRWRSNVRAPSHGLILPKGYYEYTVYNIYVADTTVS